jgi:hypothetical protein
VDQVLLGQLARSWIRRKRFEARLQAIEIGRMLFGGKGQQSAGAAKEIPADEFLRLYGAEL